MKNENVSKFWIIGILKGLVIIISNQSILTNTFFHYGTIWIKNLGAPRGTILKKIKWTLWSRLLRQWMIKFLIQKLFLEFFENQAKKNEFCKIWFLVIWYASRLATASSLPNLFSMTKTTSLETTIFQNHPWLIPCGTLIEKNNCPLSHNPFLLTEMA